MEGIKLKQTMKKLEREIKFYKEGEHEEVALLKC